MRPKDKKELRWCEKPRKQKSWDLEEQDQEATTRMDKLHLVSTSLSFCLRGIFQAGMPNCPGLHAHPLSQGVWAPDYSSTELYVVRRKSQKELKVLQGKENGFWEAKPAYQFYHIPVQVETPKLRVCSSFKITHMVLQNMTHIWIFYLFANTTSSPS